MIHTVTVENPRGEKLEFNLPYPEPIGIYVKEIKGISPPKADINTMEISTWDGDVYVSSRLSKRNIVLTFGIIGAPSVEDARHLLYKYFPIKKKVKLTFTTDSRVVQTEGYVEENDVQIFSQNETAQISVICPDPYFYEPDISEHAFIGVEPLFEFPFENPVGEETLEFGEIRLDTRAVLVYTGDADTGMTMTLTNYAENVGNIRINNLTTQSYIAINVGKITKLTGYAFSKGDSIVITTNFGRCSAVMRKGGNVYNILGAINKDADWFQLTQGDNVFDFNAEIGVEDLMLTFTYRNAFGGV